MSYWTFYSDSDFASNAELQNKRRSQNGFMCCLGGAPVTWTSKIHSKCWAHEKIGRAHADTSVAAAEVYAAGNAVKEMLFISYVADALRISCSLPQCLQLDNDAAKVFAQGTRLTGKLKHIDSRQCWVQDLRDTDVILPVHVKSKMNLADFCTKIQSANDFKYQRECLMKNSPERS